MVFGFLVLGGDMKILVAVIIILVLGFGLVKIQPMQKLRSTGQDTPAEDVTAVDPQAQGNNKKASLLVPREMQGRRAAASSQRIASYQLPPSQREVRPLPKTGSLAYQSERRAMSNQGTYSQQRQDYAKSYYYKQQREKSQAYARSINQAQQNQGRPTVSSPGSVAYYKPSGIQSGIPAYQRKAYNPKSSQAAANRRTSTPEPSQKSNYQKNSKSVPCTYKNGQVVCR